MVRAKRLTGLNPLAYLGVEPDSPLQFTIQNRAPKSGTTSDYQNWNVGTLWLNKSNQDVFMLVNKDNRLATWIMFAAAPVVVGGDNINISGVNTVNLNETIHWPNTNMAGTSGMIFLGGAAGVGGDRFLHNYGLTGRNVFLGTNAGNLTLDPTTGNNVGVGPESLMSLDTGTQNVAIGKGALTSADDCNNNVAIGTDALMTLTGAFPLGTQNTFVGYKSGESLTTGSFNTAFGEQSLANLTTGEYNIVMGSGDFSGGAYTGAETSNLIIGNDGVIGESNTIRIGTTGAGNGQQNLCFIAGIFGVTTAAGIAVYVNADGKLGTVVSSKRYKENIEDMGDQSSPAMDLRTVTFNYKKDETKEKQWGLIAEEVNDILPDIVIKSHKGDIETVQYHNLIPMLLNEAQKLSSRIKTLEDIVSKKGV